MIGGSDLLAAGFTEFKLSPHYYKITLADRAFKFCARSDPDGHKRLYFVTAYAYRLPHGESVEFDCQFHRNAERDGFTNIKYIPSATETVEDVLLQLYELWDHCGAIPYDRE